MVVVCWIFRLLLVDFFGLKIFDIGIVIVVVLLLFVLLVNKGDGECIFDWESVVRVLWGVLFLFGGGLILVV